MAIVTLKPRKARPFYGRHPWVLESAIDRVEGDPADGDEVDLLADTGQWIARGLYNSHSRIRVRLYSWLAGESLDEPFWRSRLLRALQLRSTLQLDDKEGAARLVNSEADGLSGLTIDRYGDHLVLQVTSLAIATRVDLLARLALETSKARGAIAKTEKGVARLEGLTLDETATWGEPVDGPAFIQEHGVRYGVDLAAGQKTGFYLDQRDNRRAAAGYLRNRRVLDMFCYSGGFSLCAAMLGGANHVLGIDSSERAIALARANAELNGVPNAHFEVSDAFATLEAQQAAGRRYGAIVLDPPKFAQSRKALPESLRAYHQLNRQAVDLLEPDGILVTCSCSGYVSREDFLHMLAEVAQRSGREIQVLEQRGAAADHPVSVTCPENEYLKCLICRVA